MVVKSFLILNWWLSLKRYLNFPFKRAKIVLFSYSTEYFRNQYNITIIKPKHIWYFVYKSKQTLFNFGLKKNSFSWCQKAYAYVTSPFYFLIVRNKRIFKSSKMYLISLCFKLVFVVVIVLTFYIENMFYDSVCCTYF